MHRIIESLENILGFKRVFSQLFSFLFLIFQRDHLGKTKWHNINLNTLEDDYFVQMIHGLTDSEAEEEDSE